MRPQKKELMELIATILLIAVFLLVVVRAVARVGNAKRRSNKPAVSSVPRSGVAASGASAASGVGTAVSSVQQSGIPKGELWKKLQEDGKALKMKRDPFTGISFVPLQKNETLSGILWSKEHPLAIINEAIVKVGDKIGVSTVMDIRQDSVIISDGVKETELRLE